MYKKILCFSIAVHPNKVTIATGQSSAGHAQMKADDIHAHVRLWRSDTLHTLHILGINILQRAVTALAFSVTQNRLAVVDDSTDHELSVWDVTSGQFLATTSVGKSENTQIDLPSRMFCNICFTVP